MEINLCVAGFGGQGVMTLGKFLSEAVSETGGNRITFFPSYGAEQRGGTANCFVVISDDEIGAPVGDEMDHLVVLNQPSFDKFIGTLKEGGTLFINSSIVSDKIDRDDITLVKLPVTELSLEIGSSKVLNIVMLGAYIGYTDIVDKDIVWQSLVKKLGKKPELLPLNEKAYKIGLELGAKCKA